jgi:putative DNA primase/helicase
MRWTAASIGYRGARLAGFSVQSQEQAAALLGADKDARRQGQADPRHRRAQEGVDRPRADHRLVEALAERAASGCAPVIRPRGPRRPSSPPACLLLCLDFDPRTDPETGEVWTLERLKRETEEQLGCKLPESMAVLTPSDGVHLYLLVPDGGPPIGNRGNLPDHVDVRGLGGYVIAPPSVLSDGRRYRLHRKEPIGGIAKAPARAARGAARAEGRRRPSPARRRRVRPLPARGEGQSVDDAVRKYALRRSMASCRRCGARRGGRRNAAAQRKRAQDRQPGRRRRARGDASRDRCSRRRRGTIPAATTIASCWRRSTAAGQQDWPIPRDLSEIAAAARERSDRRGSRSSLPPSSAAKHGRQSSQTGGAGFEAEERGRGGDEPLRTI